MIREMIMTAVMLAAAAPAGAQTADFLVRHAEKVDESRDPLLSAAGRARARALARHLRTAGVKAISVTEYRRTALTAALGLKPIVVPTHPTQALVDRIAGALAPSVPREATATAPPPKGSPTV